MKAIVLAAGYGIRLAKGLQELEPHLKKKYEPLVKDKPKPLVLIAGKPLIEYLLEKIEQETDISDVYIVTNNRFYGVFQNWLAEYTSSLNVKILNDGTGTNEARLGVLGDLEFAVKEGEIDDDLFVLAGDTLLEMRFGDLINYFNEKKKDVISVYEEERKALHRRGVVVVDDLGKIINFLEKPADPQTNLAAPIAYVLTKETVKRFSEFLGEDYAKESNLIEQLVKSGESEIYAFRFKKRYDVGTIADLIQADEEFSRRLRE